MVPPRRRASDAGAQFQLAAIYCTGAGVVRNLEEAVKWYRRSAEQGDRYAQYMRIPGEVARESAMISPANTI
jgi:TPR repeat protein